jgi:hypothetical protein
MPQELSRRTRLTARLRGGALDRALIAGADPSSSAALAARASLLTSTCHRERLADGLGQLMRRAEEPQRRWWDPAERQAISANRSELHRLAVALRGGGPLYAAGVARLNRLLSDGTGPAFAGDAAALAGALGEARAALAGAERPGR